MIERYTLADVERITGVPVQIAPRVSEADMAVLGQVPLYPAIFSYVSGVFEGDTQYTNQYFQLRSLARTLNRGLQPGARFNTANPRTLFDSARQMSSVPPEVARLVNEHDEFRRDKEAIMRSLRSEALNASSFTTGQVEEIDYSPDLIPLYVIEGQLAVLGIQNIRAMRDLATGDVTLTPTEDTQLIVVADTSDSTEASHQAFSEGGPDNFDGTFDPIDEQHLERLDADEVEDLTNFNAATQRIINAGAFLPQLISSHGWRG